METELSDESKTFLINVIRQGREICQINSKVFLCQRKTSTTKDDLAANSVYRAHLAPRLFHMLMFGKNSFVGNTQAGKIYTHFDPADGLTIPQLLPDVKITFNTSHATQSTVLTNFSDEQIHPYTPFAPTDILSKNTSQVNIEASLIKLTEHSLAYLFYDQLSATIQPEHHATFGFHNHQLISSQLQQLTKQQLFSELVNTTFTSFGQLLENPNAYSVELRVNPNNTLSVINIVYFNFSFMKSGTSPGRQYLKSQMQEIKPSSETSFKNFNLKQLETLKVAAKQKTTSAGKTNSRVAHLEQQVSALQLRITELQVLSNASISRLEHVEASCTKLTADTEFVNSAFKSTPRDEEKALSATTEESQTTKDLVNIFLSKNCLLSSHFSGRLACLKNFFLRILRTKD